jgi:hypothetical protein
MSLSCGLGDEVDSSRTADWSATALSGRFEIGACPSTAVTRGLDPRVHPLRIGFAKVMDARVKPAHDDRAGQIDRDRYSNHQPWILDCPVNPPIKSGEGNDIKESQPDRKMP